MQKSFLPLISFYFFLLERLNFFATRNELVSSIDKDSKSRVKFKGRGSRKKRCDEVAMKITIKKGIHNHLVKDKARSEVLIEKKI